MPKGRELFTLIAVSKVLRMLLTWSFEKIIVLMSFRNYYLKLFHLQ